MRLGRAAELALQELAEKAVYLTELRDLLVAGVPNVFYTGHPDLRLPGHASFCFEGIEGEALVYRLSSQGIYANTGSACGNARNCCRKDAKCPIC